MTKKPLDAERIVAGGAAALVGMQLALPVGLTAGAIAAIALAPVWIPRLREYVGARLLVALGMLAVGGGIVLTGVRSFDHSVGTHLLISNSMVLAGTVLSVGLLLWARDVLSAPRVALMFAVGMIIGIPIAGADNSNFWRFTLSIPLAVLALAIASNRRSRVLELVVLLVLAGVSIVNDARSGTAILMLTAVFVVWQALPLPASGRRSALRVTITVAATSAAIFMAAQNLILSGAFGESTRLRTQAQVDLSGSLILGGRPEMGATGSLFLAHPSGYGAGVLASADDILAAKTGMRAIGYDPENGYVERYMFGNGLELHSTIGDLWVRYGAIGLAFALLILIVTVSSIVLRLRVSVASALLVYLGIRTLWNLFFSPLESSTVLLVIFLTIALPHVAEPGTQRSRRSRHVQRDLEGELARQRGVVLA